MIGFRLRVTETGRPPMTHKIEGSVWVVREGRAAEHLDEHVGYARGEADLERRLDEFRADCERLGFGCEVERA